MKLLVRNLARNITEQDLREMFEAYGQLQSCHLVIDDKSGKSKGFGFVEFPNPGEAKAAAKSLNGREVAGFAIRVKKAENKPAEDDAEAKPEKKDKYRDKAVEAKSRVRGSRKPRQEPREKPRQEYREKPAAEATGAPKLKTNSAWSQAKPKQSDD